MQAEFNPIRSILNGKKLRGITRITTTDVNTGAEKVTVDENMITNSIEKLFTNNLSGLGNYTKLLPIRSLFSGVLLFGDTLNVGSSNGIVPSQDVASLIGHAGTEAHSTANPRRGNPNAVETVIGDKSFKGVWTWDTSQAIGTIKSVALCSGVLGNMGTRPWDATYTPYQPFNVEAVQSSVGTTWTRELAKSVPIEVDALNCEAISLFISGTSFEEITCYHDTAFLGISRDIHDFTEKSHRTATLSANVGSKFTVFNTSDSYYIVSCANKHHLDIQCVNKATLAVTTAAIETVDNLLSDATIKDIFHSIPCFPNTETDFWWPSTDKTTFYKCSFEGGGATAEVVTLTASGYYDMQPIRINDKLILGPNYLFNYDTFYSIAPAPLPTGFNSGTYCAWGNIPYEMVAGAYGFVQGAGGQLPLGLINHNLWITTKNNLAEARTKDASQVMKVEYTITEE